MESPACLAFSWLLMNVADHLSDGLWPLDIFNRTNHPDPDWSVSNIACPCADPISELLRKMVSLFMLFRSIRFIANEEWRHYGII